MPANIESMFSVRQMPWHREGTIVQDYPDTWTQARTLAGLDWDPVTAPVYAPVGINEDGTAHYEPIEGWKTITRSDTGAVLSISKDIILEVQGRIAHVYQWVDNPRTEKVGVMFTKISPAGHTIISRYLEGKLSV